MATGPTVRWMSEALVELLRHAPAVGWSCDEVWPLWDAVGRQLRRIADPRAREPLEGVIQSFQLFPASIRDDASALIRAARDLCVEIHVRAAIQPDELVQDRLPLRVRMRRIDAQLAQPARERQLRMAHMHRRRRHGEHRIRLHLLERGSEFLLPAGDFFRTASAYNLLRHVTLHFALAILQVLVVVAL